MIVKIIVKILKNAKLLIITEEKLQYPIRKKERERCHSINYAVY